MHNYKSGFMSQDPPSALLTDTRARSLPGHWGVSSSIPSPTRWMLGVPSHDTHRCPRAGSLPGKSHCINQHPRANHPGQKMWTAAPPPTAPTTSLQPQPPTRSPLLSAQCYRLRLPPQSCPNLSVWNHFAAVSLFCVRLPSLSTAGGCAAVGAQCWTTFRSDEVLPLCTAGPRRHWPRVAAEHPKRAGRDSHWPLSVATRLRPLGTSLSESHSVCPASGFLH